MLRCGNSRRNESTDDDGAVFRTSSHRNEESILHESRSQHQRTPDGSSIYSCLSDASRLKKTGVSLGRRSSVASRRSSYYSHCRRLCTENVQYIRLTAAYLTTVRQVKNRDHLRNPTLGNRAWATFFTSVHNKGILLKRETPCHDR